MASKCETCGATFKAELPRPCSAVHFVAVQACGIAHKACALMLELRPCY